MAPKQLSQQVPASKKKKNTCSGASECLKQTGDWKEQKIKGYLYSAVPASDVSMNFDPDSKVLFDVCVSNHKKGLLYTRRRDGDGLWRSWPLLEHPCRSSVYAKDARGPWQTQRLRGRHAPNSDHRRVLRDTQVNQTLVPVNMHLWKREDMVLLCCIDLRVGGRGGFKVENRSLHSSDEDLEKSLKDSVKVIAGTQQSNNGAAMDSVVQDHEECCELIRKKRESIKAKDTDQDDTDDILRTYDNNMLCVEQKWGLPDGEAEKMDEADEARKRDEDTDLSHQQAKKESFWSDTWRQALHEGARRFLVLCLTDETLPFERRLVRLMEDDVQVKNKVLDEFGVDDDIKRVITTCHMKGEALELLACYLALARGQYQLRDHRETDRVVHINTQVERVFMSGAPLGSPFRLEDGDLVNLMPREAPENVRAFARKLEGHCKRDRFLDVLVVLKDPNNQACQWHFRAIQCKARRERRSNVSMSKYLASLWQLALEGLKVNCLVSLEWMSNCYELQQPDCRNGDYSILETEGYVKRMMYNNMVAEEASVLEAVGRASRGFSTPLQDLLHANEIRPYQPRPFQKKAYEKTLPQARKAGQKYVTVMAATGSGKSDLICLDGLCAQAEQNHELPLLATCPSLFLVYQLAVIFALHEQRQLKGSGEEGDIGEKRRCYYVVCSDPERVTCPLLRTITNEELVTVMLQHLWAGTLGYCRFFTTVQGSGRFWDKINTFIRVTRGVDADLMEPVFGTFIRDEVHSQSGASDKHWSLGLNIPAKWCPSYTATPAQDKISKKMIASAILETEEAEEEEEEEEEEGEEEEEEEGEKEDLTKLCDLFDDDGHSSSDDDDENTASEDDFILNPDQRTDRDDLQKIMDAENEYGLRGLQALSDSLQFISVDEAHKYHKDVDMNVVCLVRDAWRVHGGNLAKISEAIFKPKRDIVLFDVKPEQRKGMCLCATRSNLHKPWCPYANMGETEMEPETGGLFRAFVDDGGQLNWIRSSRVRVKGSDERAHNPVVLGWHVESKTLCVRLGSPRGLAIHDSSSFGWGQGRNFIGPPVVRYTFGEAFQADPAILADPAVAVYAMDPMMLPLHSDDPGLTMEQIRACMGYETVTRENRNTGEMQTGIRITNATRICFKLDFPEEGKRIHATGREYATVMLLIRLLKLQVVKKPIVFCPSGLSCRRSMSLFKLMSRRHLDGDGDFDVPSSEIGCAHVFQSYIRSSGSDDQEPEEITQAMHVREHILGEFRSHERFVLFNTNLLSTGVNLPSCDAAVLVSPTSKSRTLLQRWGRSLRVESHRPDKRGYIALVGEDPKEATEDVERREHALGLENMDIFKDGGKIDREKMERMHRIVEAAVSNDNSRKTLIGDTLDTVVDWDRQGRERSVGGRGRRPSRVQAFFPGCPPGGYEVSLSEGEERALAMMFNVRGKKLMQRTWLENYREHKETLEKANRWVRTENDEGNRPDVFKRVIGIEVTYIEKKVAIRRSNLMKMEEFGVDCKEFHEFYFKELGYDFRIDWERNKARENLSWPQKFELHKKAMVTQGRWTISNNDMGNRPEVFKQNAGIEKRIALRRYELIRLESYNDDCQEFHDFYFRELQYDFKMDWEQIHAKDSWHEKYKKHKKEMQQAGRWVREKNKNGNRPKVFKRDSKIEVEKDVGLRRSNLLGRRASFDDDCQEFHDFYFIEIGYNFKMDWEQNRANRQTEENIDWLEMFKKHKQAMVIANKWNRAVNENGNKPEVFNQRSKIPEEKTLGQRRNKLMTKKKIFDDDCQDFHDFYFRELGYDFQTDWEQNKATKNERKRIPWSEKFKKHKEVMIEERRWIRSANGNKPDVFRSRSGIQEEEAAARRITKLRGKTTFDSDCQEFHDFYFRELGYDFKAEWEQNDANRRERKRRRGDASNTD